MRRNYMVRLTKFEYHYSKLESLKIWITADFGYEVYCRILLACAEKWGHYYGHMLQAYEYGDGCLGATAKICCYPYFQRL